MLRKSRENFKQISKISNQVFVTLEYGETQEKLLLAYKKLLSVQIKK